MDFPIELTQGMKVEYDGSEAVVAEDITIFDDQTAFYVTSEGMRQVWIWSIEGIECSIIKESSELDLYGLLSKTESSTSFDTPKGIILKIFWNGKWNDYNGDTVLECLKQFNDEYNLL